MTQKELEKWKSGIKDEISVLEKQMKDAEKKAEELYNSNPPGKDWSYEISKEASKYEREAEDIKRKIFYMNMFDTKPLNEIFFNEYWYSDIQAYVCVKMFTPNKVGVVRLKTIEKPEAAKKRMESFIPGGFVGHFDNSLQEYDFEIPEYKEEDIRILRRSKAKHGVWTEVGNCNKFILSDHPVEFYDFNF